MFTWTRFLVLLAFRKSVVTVMPMLQLKFSTETTVVHLHVPVKPTGEVRYEVDVRSSEITPTFMRVRQVMFP